MENSPSFSDTNKLPNQKALLPLVISIIQVSQITTLSRSTIYRMIKKGDFPKAIRLTQNRNGFLREEIYEWVNGRTRAN